MLASSTEHWGTTNKGTMRAESRVLILLAAVVLLTSAAGARQNSQELQTKFEQENDAVRRAKMMIKISRASFGQISQQVAAGDNTDALKTLQQLVEDAQSCSDALDAKEKNPESHSSGFRQLQIATRESLRRLDDLTVGLTRDEQTPFLAIRKNLDRLNRHLIRELFPHQPLPPLGDDDSDETPAEPK